MKAHLLKLAAFALLNALAVQSHENTAAVATSLRGATAGHLAVLRDDTDVREEDIDPEFIAKKNNKHTSGRYRNGKKRRCRSVRKSFRRNMSANGTGNRKRGAIKGKNRNGKTRGAAWNSRKAAIYRSNGQGGGTTTTWDRKSNRKGRKFNPCAEGEEEYFEDEDEGSADEDEEEEDSSEDEEEDPEELFPNHE